MDHVLVTGGAGFIGSHTTRRLLALGLKVRVLDALRPPVHEPGAAPDLPAGAELRVGSVEDPVAMASALRGVDAVLHVAAYQDYLTDFSTFYRVNAVSTALLYELIVRERLPVRRVVFAATQAEYGEGPYRCAEHGVVYPDQRSSRQLVARQWDLVCPTCGRAMEPVPAREEVVRPQSTYAMSKRAAEELALVLGARHDIPTIALRYSIVQGPGQSFRNAYSGALRAFTVQALHAHRPLLYEDGLQQRDYVWIGDVVAANVLGLTSPDLEFGTFNVGGDRTVTVRQLADMVIEAAETDVTPDLPGIYRVGDTRHISSDVSRLRALGWSPTMDQRSIVRAYVDWARAQPGLSDTYEAARRHMEALGVLKAVPA